MSTMPYDYNGYPIPVLGFKLGDGTHQVSITSTSNRNSTPFFASTRVVTIFTTVDCFIELGADTSATSNSTRHFIPANMYIDVKVSGTKGDIYPYMAVVRKSVDGTLYISERT